LPRPVHNAASAAADRGIALLTSAAVSRPAAVVGIAALGLAALAFALRRHEDAGPPVLQTLPPFTLVERSGQPIGLGSLRGRPWVADFMFDRALRTDLAKVAEER
jgi:cytochrome oxidase Cu insertion factor (SCO1/SenC/PrrC family)